MTEQITRFLRPDDGPVFHALTEAAYQLLQNTPIDSLTISELVDKAGISRATFYRHFKDKYDLVNAIHLRVLQGTLLRYFEGAGFQEVVSATWAAFTRHKRFYRNALTSRDVNSLGNFIFCQTYRFYLQALDKSDFRMTKLEARVLRQYTFGSVALLSEWVLGEIPEDLEQYMQASLIGLPDFVRQYLGD
jgi:AcrR family transcriptional regulator